jgi:hypothetical protein
MRLFIYLIFILYANQVYGQSTIKGKVIDSMNRKGIERVTLSVKGRALGQSDKNGSFTFALNDINKNDSLVFSSILYIPKKIAVRDLINGTIVVVVLSENVRQLAAVNITKRKSKPKWLYNKTRNNNSFTIASGTIAGFKEFAKGFVTENSGLWLKRIKLTKYSVNEIDIPYRSRFILHIYDVDSTSGGPGKELFNKEIYLDQGEYKPIVLRNTPQAIYYEYPSRDDIIDLSKYAILIPNKVFFVGIEILFIPFNQVLIEFIGTNAKLESERRNIEKSNHSISIAYLPFISANFFLKKDYIDSKYTMNWFRDIKNQWMQRQSKGIDFSIGEWNEIRDEILIDVEMVD